MIPSGRTSAQISPGLAVSSWNAYRWEVCPMSDRASLPCATSEGASSSLLFHCKPSSLGSVFGIRRPSWNRNIPATLRQVVQYCLRATSPTSHACFIAVRSSIVFCASAAFTHILPFTPIANSKGNLAPMEGSRGCCGESSLLATAISLTEL